MDKKDLEKQILNIFEDFCAEIVNINYSNDNTDFKELYFKDTVENVKIDLKNAVNDFKEESNSFEWFNDVEILPKLNTLVILREYDNGNLYATHIAKLIKDNEENPYVWIIPYIVENDNEYIPIYIDKSHQLFWSYIPDIPVKLIKEN